MGEDRNERRYIAEERAAVLDDEEIIFIIAGDNRKGCVVGAV